ncbi:histone-fold-containing protein [Pilobolus umbonatus]|nr:histone-fold-containing protein [Pilobolus umbonatus]
MSTEITSTPTKTTDKSHPGRTPGVLSIPIARIKRVIKEDKEISQVNTDATFCIGYATELFTEYLVQEAFAKAQYNKRKTIQYKDLAQCVKETEQFEFLEDVIPPTMKLKAAIEKSKEMNGEDKPAKRQKTQPSVEEDTTVDTPEQEEAADDDMEMGITHIE